MNKNAESRKFVNKELKTLSDVQAAFMAIFLDLRSGAITPAENRTLLKKPTERMKQIEKLLKDKDINALASIMK
jgi:hypothetical protein